MSRKNVPDVVYYNNKEYRLRVEPMANGEWSAMYIANNGETRDDILTFFNHPDKYIAIDNVWRLASRDRKVSALRS